MDLFARRCTVTPFMDWLEKPWGGGVVTVYKPSLEEWMYPITQRPPTGTELQVHVWACACAELSLHCPQPCGYLTFPPSHSLFLCFTPLCFSSLVAQFCFADSSTSASPSLTEGTRPPLPPPPPPPLLCRCHNLDDSLISNYLRPNFRELACFSVD